VSSILERVFEASAEAETGKGKIKGKSQQDSILFFDNACNPLHEGLKKRKKTTQPGSKQAAAFAPAQTKREKGEGKGGGEGKPT